VHPRMLNLNHAVPGSCEMCRMLLVDSNLTWLPFPTPKFQLLQRQLHARVAHYDGLPPDMRLAKERVHEVLQELDDVDKQLQQRINDMVVGA
jgi:hypothetical protein